MKKTELPCLLTHQVAGPCAECGEYQTAGVHLVGLRILCAAHCPVCKPLSHDWQRTAAPVGEQLGLLA